MNQESDDSNEELKEDQLEEEQDKNQKATEQVAEPTEKELREAARKERAARVAAITNRLTQPRKPLPPSADSKPPVFAGCVPYTVPGMRQYSRVTEFVQ